MRINKVVNYGIVALSTVLTMFNARPSDAKDLIIPNIENPLIESEVYQDKDLPDLKNIQMPKKTADRFANIHDIEYKDGEAIPPMISEDEILKKDYKQYNWHDPPFFYTSFNSWFGDIDGFKISFGRNDLYKDIFNQVQVMGEISYEQNDTKLMTDTGFEYYSADTLKLKLLRLDKRHSSDFADQNLISPENFDRLSEIITYGTLESFLEMGYKDTDFTSSTDQVSQNVITVNPGLKFHLWFDRYELFDVPKVQPEKQSGIPEHYIMVAFEISKFFGINYDDVLPWDKDPYWELANEPWKQAIEIKWDAFHGDFDFRYTRLNGKHEDNNDFEIGFTHAYDVTKARRGLARAHLGFSDKYGREDVMSFGYDFALLNEDVTDYLLAGISDPSSRYFLLLKTNFYTDGGMNLSLSKPLPQFIVQKIPGLNRLLDTSPITNDYADIIAGYERKNYSNAEKTNKFSIGFGIHKGRKLDVKGPDLRYSPSDTKDQIIEEKL